MSFEPLNPSRRQLIGMAGSIALAVSAGNAIASVGAKKSAFLPIGSFYRDVDDIRIYCEVHGSGPLMILQSGAWILSINDKNHPYMTF